MAVPKYKISKAKTRRRRAMNMKKKAPVLISCTNCGSRIQRHRVCPKCGFYRGRQILEVEELD